MSAVPEDEATLVVGSWQAGMGRGRDENGTILPGNLLASSLVILQIVAKVKDKNIPLYTNKLHNSEISCRPLRNWQVPETSENAKAENKR